MAVSWDYFDKFKGITDEYLPLRGEGNSQATQIVVAVNKLIYRWYNDGDTYDNVHTLLLGWCSDLSTYANWLYNNIPETAQILRGVYDCINGDEYEDILKELADFTLDGDFLKAYEDSVPTVSIYNCRELGPFEFEDYD